MHARVVLRCVSAPATSTRGVRRRLRESIGVAPDSSQMQAAAPFLSDGGCRRLDLRFADNRLRVNELSVSAGADGSSRKPIRRSRRERRRHRRTRVRSRRLRTAAVHYQSVSKPFAFGVSLEELTALSTLAGRSLTIDEDVYASRCVHVAARSGCMCSTASTVARAIWRHPPSRDFLRDMIATLQKSSRGPDAMPSLRRENRHFKPLL